MGCAGDHDVLAHRRSWAGRRRPSGLRRRRAQRASRGRRKGAGPRGAARARGDGGAVRGRGGHSVPAYRSDPLVGAERIRGRPPTSACDCRRHDGASAPARWSRPRGRCCARARSRGQSGRHGDDVRCRPDPPRRRPLALGRPGQAALLLLLPRVRRGVAASLDDVSVPGVRRRSRGLPAHRQARSAAVGAPQDRRYDSEGRPQRRRAGQRLLHRPGTAAATVVAVLPPFEMFMDHPPIEQRIRRLDAIARELGQAER